MYSGIRNDDLFKTCNKVLFSTQNLNKNKKPAPQKVKCSNHQTAIFDSSNKASLPRIPVQIKRETYVIPQTKFVYLS